MACATGGGSLHPSLCSSGPGMGHEGLCRQCTAPTEPSDPGAKPHFQAKDGGSGLTPVASGVPEGPVRIPSSDTSRTEIPQSRASANQTVAGQWGGGGDPLRPKGTES